MSGDPKWITAHQVQRLHDIIIEETGGRAGTRDFGLLESALARPQNLHAYGENSIFELAASYAAGIAKNHAFVDGNKRTAFMSSGVFLGLNGYSLENTPETLHAEKMVALAEDKIDREDFAEHLRSHSISLDQLKEQDAESNRAKADRHLQTARELLKNRSVTGKDKDNDRER